MNYSVLDRFLHRVAFGAPSIQLTATEIENKIFGSVYDAVDAARPIFITSLPRAGTTILLEAFSRFPSLATHTYRDMPFVMAPVLWSQLSTAFRKGSEPSERAHGDGIRIGYDSPEAFEEILWKAFWPEKYADTGIALWSPADGKDEARAFFIDHMKKIIALRRPDRPRGCRYVSKNNGNIARVDLIGHMFPDAAILVPFRHPIDQATSLRRQHGNFLKIQGQDPFSRRYMADIGHFEFGELHRLIAFPGLDELTAGRDPFSLDYWLCYWIAAFEHLLARQDAIMFLSYEAVCADPCGVLAEICEDLGVPDEGDLESVARLFNAPPPRQVDRADLDPKLRRRAEDLHEALLSVST